MDSTSTSVQPEAQLKPIDAVDRRDAALAADAPDTSDTNGSFDGAPAAALRSEAEIARSEKNISAWKSYLPADCVERMIEMGWDYST